jgi:hypothetical protein
MRKGTIVHITHVYLLTTVSIFALLGCGSDAVPGADDLQSPAMQQPAEMQPKDKHTNPASGLPDSTDPRDVSPSEMEVAANTANATEASIMQITGTITYKDFEGGFYGFVSKDGKNYTLNNLAKEHRKNGLVVEIKAEAIEDMATTTQFGQLLRVHDITIIDASNVVDIKNTNVM